MREQSVILLFLLAYYSTLCTGIDWQWRQKERANHECRSCHAVPVDESNCPDEGYDCDKKQPLSAAVLTAEDSCRCQSISCANHEWRLAVNGSIVHKVRCQGNQWISATGLPAPSVVCAKVQPVEECKPPSGWDGFKCNVQPFSNAPVTKPCFNPAGNELANCVGDSLIVMEVPGMSYYITTDAATECTGEQYTASTFTLRRNVDQISCMKCPHMSGEVPTTYTDPHNVAVYDKCIVRCLNGGVLHGKNSFSDRYYLVADATAYYAWDYYNQKFVFVDSLKQAYVEDFYCEKTP